MKIVPFILIISLAMAGAIIAANLPTQQSRQAELLLGTALHQEEVEGDLEAAIKTYRKVLAEYSDNRLVAAKALLQIGQCYEKLGKDEARKAYQQLISDYADQQEQAELARVRLAALSKTPDVDRKPVFTTRQVLAGPLGWFDYSSPSPEGRYLFFPGTESGLAVRDLEAGAIRSLTNEDPMGGGAEFSRWSPDGKYIAYGWDNDDYADLRIISAEGGKSRILNDFDKDSWLQVFDWSPDGKKILIWLEKGWSTEQIVLVSAADGATTILKIFEGHVDRPQAMRFSRDGQYIAYDYPQEKGVRERDIFVISTDGKREFSLLQHPADDRLLGWLPDGKSILFASDRTGSLDMWLQTVSNWKAEGLPALVKRGVDKIVPLGFTQGGAFYYGLGQGMLDVYSARIDFQSDKALTPPEVIIKSNEGRNCWPDYSADGKYLAYLTRQSSSFPPGPGFEFNILCIRSLESGEEREFTSGFKRLAAPQWSPDGQSLYLTAWDDQGSGIYRVNAQTGEFTLIMRNNLPPSTFVNKIIGHHRITPDGKTIIYLIKPYGPSLIIARNLITGEEKQLYTGNFLRFSISPDGQWLALLSCGWQRTILRVMSLSEGWVKDLLQFEAHHGIPPAAIEWTTDGKYILFQGLSGAKNDIEFPMWRVAADGGEPQKLNLPMVVSQGLSVHPDGQHLVFCSDSSQLNTTAGIWVMENFLQPAAGTSK